ncbi:MAG: serine/threonine protein kinase [Chlamydiia bacterium]|nr:serine/threonine protein kinase [Chlamydiia bacterium]
MKNRKLYSSIFSIFTLFFTTSLCAEITEQTQRSISAELKAKKYDQLGMFLKNKIDHTDADLAILKELALQQHANALVRAIDATVAFKEKRSGLGISTGSFLQTALFIETSLPRYTSHNRTYLTRRETGLSHNIEYDPHTHSAFIVINGVRSAYLGKGARKTVYKSVLYNPTQPQIVARAEQQGKMDRELKISRRLRGAKGVCSMKGFGEHKKKGRQCTTIYTKLYNSGSLKSAFLNNEHFSLFEKMKIALGILEGLESMHKRGIIHRDLAAQNVFLNIPTGNSGNRMIEAVVADFGWSNYVSKNSHEKAQANIKNSAPEGIFYQKLKGSDYFATDIYAAGLVLYHLQYEKKASWKENYNTSGSPKSNYKKLVHTVKRDIQSKQQKLSRVKVAGKNAIKKNFEQLILRMISINPKRRGSAPQLRAQVERLLIKWTILEQEEMNQTQQEI